MSANYPQLFTQEFTTSVELLLQQKDSRLSGKVRNGSHVGEQAAPVDQIGPIEMEEVTTRFGDIGRTDAPLSRRWVAPTDFELNQQVDSFDELKVLSDPKSMYVQNAVNGANRQKDRVIIDGFFGDALTGKNGSSTVTFAADGGQTIAVTFGGAGNTGATVAKLRQAKRLFMEAEVDEDDPLWFGINGAAHDRLLQEAQVVSRDFNADAPVLTNGKITRFMGFNFVHSELFETNGSGFRRLPCWAQSGMHLGMWKNMKIDVSERKDLSSLPWQAYVMMSIGSTRLEGPKVIELLADEAA